MEVGVHERDRVLDDADKDVSPAMGDEIEPRLHGLLTASGIEHDVEAVAVRGCLGRLESVVKSRQSADADDRLGCFRTFGIAVEDDHASAGQAGEQGGAETDRAGTDHEHVVASADGAAPHGVSSDGEKLDSRAFVSRQTIGANQIGWRHGNQLGHAAVAMNAENGDVDAAVRLSGATGNAVSTRDV